YVNGGLFSDENIKIPQFTEKIKILLLSKASDDFNWSEISPTIFGAVFESTLNPETRRSGGMHYTSIENIHKVIDPIFLDELQDEFKRITEIKVAKTRKDKLIEFQANIASLKFLDPACGSGNFLTEAYISLRRLENEALRYLYDGQISFGHTGGRNPIQVSIKQFYGIEINDFAVTVARTALWIAESQMMKETEDVVHMSLDFLPLKSYSNITEENALNIEWKSVIPKYELNYIMGNPPFVGKKEQTREQKDDLVKLFDEDAKGIGNLDYVSGWYVKAAQFMQNSYIKTAFVSTNSITQGEQVPILWEQLDKKQVYISFAHRTFRWDSEAKAKAHVHCVIIGFCVQEKKTPRKIIFAANRPQFVDNINPYLINAPTVFIQARQKPICDVPEISYGSMPIDNGNLILNEKDVEALLTESECNAKFIREYLGGQEILKGIKRWCLWLDGANPIEYMKSNFIMGRIEATKKFRLEESTRPQTLKAAETPHLFGEIRQPKTQSLVIPKVSSEDRLYIPIAIIKPEVIINGSALMIPNATLHHFGILSSNVHNAWMRTVAGRMKSDYQYSAKNVYNNFPWPSPTEQQVLEIEKAATAVLKAREAHLDVSLADMYKEKYFLLFGDLKTAHDMLNKIVMKSYGFSIKETTEESCIAELMRLYQKYVGAEKS
ncbi:MAG TPA: DNA methyltransferase, partial [Anaerovoracaceae bacterium]|nr:DNA methyltransferase [Anaerovoracaceae bacterium]